MIIGLVTGWTSSSKLVWTEEGAVLATLSLPAGGLDGDGEAGSAGIVFIVDLRVLEVERGLV